MLVFIVVVAGTNNRFISVRVSFYLNLLVFSVSALCECVCFFNAACLPLSNFPFFKEGKNTVVQLKPNLHKLPAVTSNFLLDN